MTIRVAPEAGPDDRLINVPLADGLSLTVDCSVPLREMREWSAERLDRYFAGVAMALGAIRNESLADVDEPGGIADRTARLNAAYTGTYRAGE